MGSEEFLDSNECTIENYVEEEDIKFTSIKAVFVIKTNRKTLKECDGFENINGIEKQEGICRQNERRQETKKIVAEIVKNEKLIFLDQKNNLVIFTNNTKLDAIDFNMIDTGDEFDEEGEFVWWKHREIGRLRQEKDERNKKE